MTTDIGGLGHDPESGAWLNEFEKVHQMLSSTVFSAEITCGGNEW
jgi:hypothetical protein